MKKLTRTLLSALCMLLIITAISPTIAHAGSFLATTLYQESIEERSADLNGKTLKDFNTFEEFKTFIETCVANGTLKPPTDVTDRAGQFTYGWTDGNYIYWTFTPDETYKVYIDLNGATLKDGRTGMILIGEYHLNENIPYSDYGWLNSLDAVIPPEGYIFNGFWITRGGGFGYWGLEPGNIETIMINSPSEDPDRNIIIPWYGPAESTEPTEPTTPTVQSGTYVFKALDGTTIERQTVNVGDMVTPPSAPTIAGKQFVCWLMRGEIEFNFSKASTNIGELEFIPKYVDAAQQTQPTQTKPVEQSTTKNEEPETMEVTTTEQETSEQETTETVTTEPMVETFDNIKITSDVPVTYANTKVNLSDDDIINLLPDELKDTDMEINRLWLKNVNAPDDATYPVVLTFDVESLPNTLVMVLHYNENLKVWENIISSSESTIVASFDSLSPVALVSVTEKADTTTVEEPVNEIVEETVVEHHVNTILWVVIAAAVLVVAAVVVIIVVKRKKK